MLALGEQLTHAMADIASDIPVGIDVHLVANQPHVVEEAVGEFTKTLWEAIGIVLAVSFLVLLVLLRSIIAPVLLLLVNRASASAAEILTGAIQDHKLGVIIAPRGEHTFGKGSVQTIEELKNTISWDENNNPKRCALRLTTARYYTPSGKTIDKVGITPDIEIDLPENHEAELASHGLMGDPDMTEPAISKTKKPQTIDEDEETSPVSELDKSDDDKLYMKAEK